MGLIAAVTEGAVLREAVFDVVFTSASRCRVTASFVIDDAVDLEHRLILPEGAVAELTGIGGTVVSDGDTVASGHGLLLRLRGRAPGEQRYELQYDVAQPPSATYRCPLWLPATPADGRSQDVRINVSLPRSALPAGGTLPAFTWDDERGTARLGHIPAFVRVPFGVDGASAAALDVIRTMDVIAISVLVGGTAMFLWRRRR